MNPLSKILIYVKFLRPAIFLALGLYFLSYPERLERLMERSYSNIFGVVLLMYGLFRLYTIFTVDLKKRNRNFEE